MTSRKLLTPGLTGLLGFLEFLNKEHVTYRVNHHSPDSLTVSFTIVGARFEVDFFEDDVTYSYFKGSEECLDDEAEFMRLFREGWNDD